MGLLALLAGGFPAPPAAASLPGDARTIVEALVACGTRHSLSSWTNTKRGIGCGRDVVVRHLEAVEKDSGKRMRVVIDRFETRAPRTRNVPVPMENVYAILPGTDPARERTAFVVSGHYDSMPSDVMDAVTDAPGADDDASGTAVSILAARALAPKPARATLVFAAVAGEEQGLLGAKRLLEWLTKQGYTVGGMITCDIVGATNGSPDRRVRVFSEGGPDGIDSPGRQMARLGEEIAGKDKVRLVFRLDRFGRGGDHRPFVEAGLPAVRFTEPLETTEARWSVAKTVETPPAGAPAAAPGAAPFPSSLSLEETLSSVLLGTSTDNHYFAARSVGKNGKKSIAVPAVAAVRRPPGYVASEAPRPATPPTPAATVPK
ncbi:MAG: M20/M25/M40 family metallo-hydrolase [Thermoanaerobaculia bacterium]|nr:M20/M25/M40 family metallo-hydrolase [Thermoanaerobaculia bacterium]